MVHVVLLCASLLGVHAADPPSKEAKADIPAAPGDKQTEKLAKYNELKGKAPETASAQWNLAIWCENNGLKAEAYAHFASVVRLDPTREGAWKHLGFKKVHGRWMNEDEIAEDAEQMKADKLWSPRLKKIHKDIHKGPRQDEARKAIEAIEDPRAVAPIYREFGNGGPSDQLIAVQGLAQLATPLSSKLLALLSVYGKTPEVRRRAAESLRARDSEEYLGVLVTLLTDPLKYEVKHVAGPGSPGVIYVEGEKFNVRRIYAAPRPDLSPRPGDIISYDNSGMPVIERFNGLMDITTPIGKTTNSKNGVQLYRRTQSTTQISTGAAIAEAQRAAAVSEAQLENDLDEIEKLNRQRKNFNDLVVAVARNASGKIVGDKPEEWRAAIAGRNGSEKTPKTTPAKPTYDELVPLAYRPQFAQLSFVSSITTTPPH
jgi:HEAT repeat protein